MLVETIIKMFFCSIGATHRYASWINMAKMFRTYGAKIGIVQSFLPTCCPDGQIIEMWIHGSSGRGAVGCEVAGRVSAQYMIYIRYRSMIQNPYLPFSKEGIAHGGHSFLLLLVT